MEKKLEELEHKLAATNEALGTLIAWMAQSANSPIRLDEAKQLLGILNR